MLLTTHFDMMMTCFDPNAIWRADEVVVSYFDLIDVCFFWILFETANADPWPELQWTLVMLILWLPGPMEMQS